MNRLCTICNITKTPGEYFKNSRSRDGLMKHCKSCHYKMTRSWETRNGEARRDQRRKARIKYAKLYPERVKEQAKRVRDKNKEKYTKRARAYYKQVRRNTINHYGPACKCCGETVMGFLSLDHIKNDGHIHRRSFSGNLAVWARDNNYPDSLQVLCYNCNLGKAFNNLICPHLDVKD